LHTKLIPDLRILPVGRTLVLEQLIQREAIGQKPAPQSSQKGGSFIEKKDPERLSADELWWHSWNTSE